jgi:hypothetical protein
MGRLSLAPEAHATDTTLPISQTLDHPFAAHAQRVNVSRK